MLSFVSQISKNLLTAFMVQLTLLNCTPWMHSIARLRLGQLIPIKDFKYGIPARRAAALLGVWHETIVRSYFSRHYCCKTLML